MTEKICPLLNQDCIGNKCMWSTTLRGTDPNTGNEIDEQGCSVAFLPTLLIETAKAQYQTGAAVESARNVFADALEQAPRSLSNEQD